MIERLSLYWHTIRYLKPAQILGRFRFRLLKTRPKVLPAQHRRQPSGGWAPCSRIVSMLELNCFRFLNRDERLAWPEGWQLSSLPRLWQYNLHYFDDLVADRADERRDWHRALIAQWIEDNPPGAGVGWEPYPTSLRLVNWIKWSLSGAAVPEQFHASLATQAEWLSRNLEHHLGGNHLWCNAKALVFAGAYHASEAGRRWREKGLRLLQWQLREQVLADGGHYELSPMYHALFLEDIIDLIQLGRLYPGVIPSELEAALVERGVPMLDWLQAMSHPDGEVSFFNDSVPGIAPTHQNLVDYAQAVGLPESTKKPLALDCLRDSGYLRADLDETCLICDVAPVGPDHQPGHGHADTLSFELSLGRQRLLVNTGIDRYDDDEERLRQRGTAAHNTVAVDNQDSSEVWLSFRVARRARPQLLLANPEPDRITISGSHNGYRRLPGRVTHQRTWELTNGGLQITDRLTGRFTVATGRLHLHPAVTMEANDEATCTLYLHDKRVRISVTGGTVSIESYQYHQGFGLSEPGSCIVIHFTGPNCVTAIRWGDDPD